MHRSNCPRSRTSRRLSAFHRPKLESLEVRLPPGDVLFGALVAALFASPPIGNGELTSPDNLGSTLGIDNVIDPSSDSRTIPRRGFSLPVPLLSKL